MDGDGHDVVSANTGGENIKDGKKLVLDVFWLHCNTVTQSPDLQMSHDHRPRSAA